MRVCSSRECAESCHDACAVVFEQVYHPVQHDFATPACCGRQAVNTHMCGMPQNIDLEGNVCLNILRDDWKPIMSLNQVILGLQFLFMVRSLLRCAPHGQFGGRLVSH